MPDARQTQHPGAGESESSGDDSSYTSESSQEEDPQHEEDNDKGEETEFVNVDLEFFDPSEIDYHGLKMLLRSLLDGDEFQGCSDLVEAIIRQSTVGTVVKTAETDDPIGVATVISLSRHSTLSSLEELKSFMSKHCLTKELRAKLEEAWQSDGAGLVINERLLNCPPQLASPLHHALFDEEIPWAMEDEPTEELRKSFDFKGYLFISRVYRDTLQDESPQIANQQAAPKPRKRLKVQSEGSPGSVIVYTRPEDQFYHQHCLWYFLFPVSNRPVRKDELQPLRLVMWLDSAAASAARVELYKVIGNVAVGQEPEPVASQGTISEARQKGKRKSKDCV